MEKVNNTNNNCRFCLRIFEELEERIGITSQISDEFRNITQTEVKSKQNLYFKYFAFFMLITAHWTCAGR